MKIEHRNTYTPTEVIKGGLSKIQAAIKQDSNEVFIIRSSRTEEEMAIISVEQAEILFDLRDQMDRIIDEITLNEFYERRDKEGGFDSVEIQVDPSVVLSDDEKYIPRKKRRKEGAL